MPPRLPSVSSEYENKTISYRQIGTNKGKKVKPPRPNQTVEQTPNSIPSKFSTFLNVGIREPNGFGTRTYRFNDGDNELPGPGTYHKPNSLVRDSTVCGSVSRLGYGMGFVSKVKRFGDSIFIEEEASSLPGPGNYNISNPLFETKSSYSCYGTSSFAPSQKPSLHDNLTLPGPGAYADDHSISSLAPKKKLSSAVFASKCSRVYQPLQEGPSPGDYNITSQIKVKDKNIKQASFASTTSRNQLNRQSNDLPGPGSYEVVTINRKQQQINTTNSVIHSTKVFTQEKKTKKNFIEPTPGPGWYYRQDELQKAPASTSCFLSNTFRDSSSSTKATNLKPPGPAFYQPQSIGHKSHLLNNKNKWI